MLMIWLANKLEIIILKGKFAPLKLPQEYLIITQDNLTHQRVEMTWLTNKTGDLATQLRISSYRSLLLIQVKITADK